MTLFALFALGFAAWFVSTLGSGGGAILLLPAAPLIFDLRDVPPVIAVASVVSGLQRSWLYRKEIVVPVLAANVPGLVLGSVLGAWALRSLEISGLGAIIGVFLVLYGLSNLLGFSVSAPPARPWHFGVASFATACLSAVVGAAGPLMNPVYLQARIVKQAMIGTKAASTLAMQVAKLVSFGALGIMRPELWGLGFVVGAGALAGNAAGKAVLVRMTSQAFARVVQTMLVVSGGLMLVRSLREAGLLGT